MLGGPVVIDNADLPEFMMSRCGWGSDRVGSMRFLLALIFLCGFTIVAGAQVLEPGDMIGISVLQDSKLDRQTVIDRAGMISFPLAGRIKAAGMTPQGLENALRSRLKSNYSTDLDITVSILTAPEKDEQQKPRIFVTGEVKAPGFFVFRPKTTVMQAIALSGGLTPFAAKRRIQIRRRIDGVESIFVFNYNDFEAGTNLEGNIDLRPEDIIVVPVRGLIE